MVDTRVYPPAPEDDGIVRETTHQAVLQSSSADSVFTPPSFPSDTTVSMNYQPPMSVNTPQNTQSQPSQPNSLPPNPPSPANITSAALNQQSAPQSTAATTSANSEKEVSPDDFYDDYGTHFPGVSKPLPELTVIEWEAPSRPFKARSRQFFSSILIIGLLISLILFFAGQVLPIAVVVAIIFLVYVMSVVPPGMVKHALTTSGIRIENKLYYWEEMGTFWYTQKYGQKLLHIEIARFPTRLVMLLGEVTEEEMTRILSEVLIQHQPEPTFYEKATEWLQEKIPLES